MGWLPRDEIGRGSAVFSDRWEAGARLAECLSAYRSGDVLVLGIPRGGVAVAAAVAQKLNVELDILVARKVGAPMSSELAIGAVTANGGRFLNEELLRELEIFDEYLQKAFEKEISEARRQEERFRGARAKSVLIGRTVIVVDDGLATGATMQAAVRSLRSEQLARLIIAVPVGSQQACDALRPEVDELVCLHIPEPFYAVGLYYECFDPIDDQQVQQILQQAWSGRNEGPLFTS